MVKTGQNGESGQNGDNMVILVNVKWRMATTLNAWQSCTKAAHTFTQTNYLMGTQTHFWWVVILTKE